MKSKIFSWLLIGVLLVAALWFAGKNTVRAPDRNIPGKETRNTRLNPARGFRRDEERLAYTAHARCRMQCRHITITEVKDILKNGAVNYRKSDLKDRPCPTYALEGYTRQDNQHLRIVFAQCSGETKVVTCIDLDVDFTCDCR